MKIKQPLHTLLLMALVMSSVATRAEDNDSNVILVSNSLVKVTKAEFNSELERMPVENRFEFLASRERIGRVIEELLLVKTLAAEARELGLEQDPQTRIKIDIAQSRILATERINHLQKQAKLPDFELKAKESYRLSPDKYQVKPQVRASHVLVALNGRSREEALKKAEEIYTQAKNGEDFGALARANSDDKGSAKVGGELNYFTAEAMIKPFSDAAFAMKVGEISKPVESKFGYHIIKVTDVKPGVNLEYETVRSKIIEELKAQYLAEYVVEYRKKIRQSENMKVDEEEIMKLKTTLPPVETK